MHSFTPAFNKMNEAWSLPLRSSQFNGITAHKIKSSE